MQLKQRQIQFGLKSLTHTFVPFSPLIGNRFPTQSARKIAFGDHEPPRGERSELYEAGNCPQGKKISLYQLLKRPQVRIEDLKEYFPFSVSSDALKGIEIEVKYSGFIRRQLAEVRSFKHLEKIKIPCDLDYDAIRGLSREIKEKLSEFRPLTLGQANRISGITPAAIIILLAYFRKHTIKK